MPPQPHPLPARSRRGRAGALVAALALGGLLLAACGGASSASSGSTSHATTTVATSAKGRAKAGTSFAAFTACLTSHGVTFTPGTGGRRPGATTSAKDRSAVAACAKDRPPGTGFAGGFGGGRASSAATAAFRNCLSLHGVKSTAPSSGARPGSPGPARGATAPLSRTGARYRAAFAACRALLPSTTTTTTRAG